MRSVGALVMYEAILPTTYLQKWYLIELKESCQGFINKLSNSSLIYLFESTRHI